MDTTYTQESATTLHVDHLRLADVTGFMQDLVGTLTCYVDQQFIAPRVLPSWIAGLRHFDEHSSRKPEHRGPQRLAYLWMLDALIKSPDALIEAMIEARSQLVAADEALQPFAAK